MKEIHIEKRPEVASIRGMVIWFILLVAGEMTLGGIAPIVSDHSMEMFLSTVCALVATLIPFLIRDEVKHNRCLPELVDEFLDKELSEKDYKLLLNAARKYPAIRPLVATAIKDGKICYRDAEPLVEQINQKFATKDLYGRQKAITSRRKLNKLVEPSSPPGRLPGQDESIPASYRRISAADLCQRRNRPCAFARLSRLDSDQGIKVLSKEAMMANDNRQGSNLDNPGIEGAPGDQVGGNSGSGMPGQVPGSQGAGAGDVDMGESGGLSAETVSGSVGSDVAEAGSDIGGGVDNSSMDAGGGIGAAVDTSRTGGARSGKGTGGTGEGGTADDTITTDETGAHPFTPGKEDDDKLMG